jgi:methyltransferase (TIGR00027 family)
MRAVHTHYDQPLIFADPYGDQLVSAMERELMRERAIQMLDDGQQARVRAIANADAALVQALRLNPAYASVLVRARFTEDCLQAAIAAGVAQYVLVGAGMDTFAWRRPDLDQKVTVFEVDHPATQGLKRDRLAAAGLTPPPNLRFVAADLEFDKLADVLAAAGYRPAAAAFFSMLGTTPFLTRAANLTTFTAIAEVAAAGSELVLDYIEPAALSAERGAAETTRIAAEQAKTSEPWVCGFEPRVLAAELGAVGLPVVEDLAPQTLQERYLSGRSDALRVAPHAHLARARRERTKD